MTDAFEALGLRPDADERAVKRAYARLLPSARPDVDPAGFQALHDAYQRALGIARRGVAAPPDGSGPGATDAARPVAEAEPGPPAPDDAPPGPGSFTVDLGALVPALLARAAAGTSAELAAWLDAATADWPLAAKPAVAPHLLGALDDGEAALAPAAFDAVAAAFGFEDVRGGLHPLRVAAVRAGVEARHDRRLRTAALAEALRPGNRGALCDRMDWTGRGGYAPPVTRFLAAVVTGPRSAARARVLRFVPFLAGAVCRFLANLDEARIDAFGPAIPPETIVIWARADARWPKITPAGGYAAVLALCTLAMAISEMSGGGSTPRPARTDAQRPAEAVALGMMDLQAQLDEAGRALAVGDLATTIKVYDRIVAHYGPAPPDALAGALSNVYFGRALLLDTFGRPAEARDAYAFFERAFAEADDPDIRALVSRARGRRAALAGR